MAEVVIASFDYEGVKIKIWAEEDGEGNVVLRIDSGDSTTTFDLNGLFIDYGNDGGSVTSAGSKANNMNGADSQDGTKFDGFDVGYELGSIGGKDANWMNGTITLTGKTLADLDGAEIGLRMQGVDSLGGGSLKLGAIAEIPPDSPPPAEDHFPEWAQPEISHITLYWRDDDYLNDVKGGSGNGSNNPDGWFTVKFDYSDDPEFASWFNGGLSNDLDDNLDDFLSFLVAQNVITEAHKESLVGVAIKGGQSGEVWYDLDGDPTDVDSPPADIPDYPIEKQELDVAYKWNAETDMWG